MLLTIKYQNRVKQVNLDKRINVPALQTILQQVFGIKSRIVGLLDQDGVYHDLVQFIQQMNNTRCTQYTLVTDESHILSDNRTLQTSLKYSQISEFSNRLHFIDFIYDLEEFQNILGGESYTCIYLIEEKDPLGIDFLAALEPLINNFNNWINFYYSFASRLSESEIYGKMLWIFKGAKKIVSIQLNNDKKMRQMDEIIQKLVQTKLQGSQVKGSTIKQTSHISSQQSPDKRRSKSIRRLVEDSQSASNSNVQGSRLITRVQAKFVQRIPSRGSVPEYQEEYRQSNNHVNDSTISQQQDSLFRIVGDLEEKEILDVTMARLVKRLLIEENREIIQVLQSYLSNAFNIQQLCEKLNKIVENCTNQQRPTSPFQALKQAKVSMQQFKPEIQINSLQSNRDSQNNSMQQDIQLEDVKNVVIERNNFNFTPEQYGMANYLWKNNDQIILQLCTDFYKKTQRGEKPSLKPIQIYSESKFNEILQQHFKISEINLIQEYKNTRSCSINAVMQHFRYETNMEQFINDLKKATLTLQHLNPNLSQPEKQEIAHSKEINLFKYSSPKAPSPLYVLMPNFPYQENDSPSPPPPSQDQKQVQQIQQIQQPQQQEIKQQKAPEVETKRVPLFSTQPIGLKGSGDELLQQSQQPVCQREMPQLQFGGLNSKKQQPQPPKPEEPKNILSHSEQISPQKRLTPEKIAKDIIFDEENFMQTKIKRRKLYQNKIDALFATQVEKELSQTFKDMLWHMDLDEPKVRLAEQLFQESDHQLYKIVKNYQSFRVVHQARTELIKLLSEEPVPEDYRKMKQYNLFMNQVRQFTLQKHLQENERNFLLKMFMDNDLQVLGTLETYLLNLDAQDMLESLQMIIRQYGKYTNINYIEQPPVVQQRKESEPKPPIPTKEIIAQYKQYFSAEEKMRLEQLANDFRDSRIDQYYLQYLKDQDLNGFIQSMKQIITIDSFKKYHVANQVQLDQFLKQLQKDGVLKIDDYMLSLINKKRNEQRIKGVFELYLFNKNQEDFVESIKSISKLLQQELIIQTLDEFEKAELLSEDKLLSLKEKAYESHGDYPKLLGAFSLYFEQAQVNKEEAQKEIIETLNIFS